MFADFLSVALLLLLCVRLAPGEAVSKDVTQVKSVAGADTSLPCTAEHKAEVQYTAVRWYKVGEASAPRLGGLLTTDLSTNTTRLYHGVDREVELQVDSLSIFLPSVTCSDGGMYQCHLAAPVGEQNREGWVLLTVAGCPERDDPQLMTDTGLVVFASTVLMLALLIFLISYGSLKNIIKDRSKTTQREILLNAPLKPLGKKDLMSIYTLGPKASTVKHVCV